MSSQRFIENEFPQYTPDCDCLQNGKPLAAFTQKVHSWINEKVESLLKEIPKICSCEQDFTVYTGVTGIAFLFLRLMDTIYKNGEYRESLVNAVKLVYQSSRKALRGKKISFLCGDAGPLALGAIIAHRENDLQEFAHCLKSLTGMLDRCCHDDSLPDELLYGRAGYLYSLLLVRKYCGDSSIPDSILEKVCSAIITYGEKLANKDNSTMPLKYIWHEKEYIGAAHGYFGIFFTLLQPELSRLPVVQSALPVINQCIDTLLLMRFPSGNFPSSVGNKTDRLVQWCHGCPAAVDCIARAYKLFGNSKYLHAAEKCCDVIWHRGLLQKGYGICHGAAGNGYSFLTVYNLTKDEKYLYYGLKFGEWCLDFGKHGCRIPDRSLSLYEGLAGTLSYLADLLEPEKPHFIGYHIA